MLRKSREEILKDFKAQVAQGKILVGVGAGTGGRIVPFGRKDDGGDLVESSFLMTSLLCARQYFKDGKFIVA